MAQFLESSLFGIVLTLTAYALAKLLYDKSKLALANPVISASAIIIAVLLILDIEIEAYQRGGEIISFMLIPATVSLAIPLYRRVELLKKHAAAIIIGVLSGSTVSIVSVLLLSRLFGLPEELTISLIPKSVTTPIALEISTPLGGLPSITAISVILTGIIGAVIGPLLLRITGPHHPVGQGLSMGTAAHAIGTSRALEMGETEGAMSSLAIGLAGVVTVILAPIILSLV